MMHPVARLVSAAEISAVALPLEDVYDLVVEGFRLHGVGETECPPQVGVHPRPGAFIHAMPAYLPTRDITGTKLISVYPGNAERGLPSTNGVIIMHDAHTGIPIAILDAGWVTSVRTAMVSMVDTTFLANPDPVFGIIGATGVTGRAHLDAIAAIFPGSRVLVGSRDPERLGVLLADFANAPCELMPCPDPEAIVRGSDVVIVCTAHLSEPLLRPDWLHAGHNVINVHSRGWPANILSSVDLVSCDDRRPITDPEHGLLEVYLELNPNFELGDVVEGQHPGRTSPDQIIFSFNYGLAIFDILVADRLLQNLPPVS